MALHSPSAYPAMLLSGVAALCILSILPNLALPVIGAAVLTSADRSGQLAVQTSVHVAHWQQQRSLLEASTDSGTPGGEAKQSGDQGAAADGSWYNATACPSWLSEYIEFHKETKHTPDAKYLVSKCFDHECFYGLGDRLRGLEFTLRAAHRLKRLLLIDVPFPAPLQSFFAPATFDWTLKDITVPPLWQTYELRGDGPLKDASLESVKQQFIMLHATAAMQMDHIKGEPDIERVGPKAHCVFRAMFKPAPKVQNATQTMLADMGIAGTQPYTAIHLRIGGGVGEGALDRYEPMSALHHSLRCARLLQKKANLTGSPIVLITDNIEVKRMALEGDFLADVVTPETVPIHFRGAGDIKMFVATVAEMGILAQSHCLVSSWGGYSIQARLWGGGTLLSSDTGCFQSTDDCIKNGKAKYDWRRRAHRRKLASQVTAK